MRINDPNAIIPPQVAEAVKRLQEAETALLKAVGYTTKVQKWRHGPDTLRWISPKGIESEKEYALNQVKLFHETGYNFEDQP
jgi:hypothetical protein